MSRLQKSPKRALRNESPKNRKMPGPRSFPELTVRDIQRFLDRIPSLLGYWNKNLVNVISNEAYAAYFGKRPSEIRGKSIKDLLGPKLFNANLPHIRAALSGVAQSFERAIPTPDGSVRETIANYIPDLVDGKVNGFFVLVTDVTPLKVAERKNREIEAKLVASSKMSNLGEMASAIAHEINNPLAIIYGSACLASRLIQGSDLDLNKLRIIINEIENTALRIEEIIDSLRIFSADGSMHEFEKVSANSIVDQTLKFCEARLKRHGVKLTKRNLSTPLFIECRSTQISQILLNLLNNAFDAVSNSKSKDIHIELKNDRNYVCFIISNSGQKITSEIADKIFQPFFTTKGVGKGTGLGLSISRGIAEIHKGTLELDLKSKQTRFVLRLPKHHR